MKKLASPRINTRNPEDIEKEFQDIKARLAEKINLLETQVDQRFSSPHPWKLKAFDVPCGEEFEPIFVVFEHSNPEDKRFVLLDLCVPHLMKGQKFSLDKKSKVFQKEQAVPAARIKRGIVFIRKENEPVVKPSTRIHCPILDFSLAQLGAEPRQKAKAEAAPRGSRAKGAGRASASSKTSAPVPAEPTIVETAQEAPLPAPVPQPPSLEPVSIVAEPSVPQPAETTAAPAVAPTPGSPLPGSPLPTASIATPVQPQSQHQPQSQPQQPSRRQQHSQNNPSQPSHSQPSNQGGQPNQGQRPQKLSGDLLEELKIAIVQECLTTIQKRRNKYIRKGLWRWIEREITDPNVHFFLIILSCMYQGEVSEALSRKFKTIEHYCKSPDTILDTIFSAESAVAPEIMKAGDRHRKALRKFLECFSQMPPFEYLRSIFLREYRTTHDSIKSRTTVFNTLKELLGRCGFSGEKEVNYPLEILDELGIFNGVMLGDYTELRIDNAGKKLKHLVPQFEWTPETIYKLREDLARILNLPAMEFNLNAFLPQAFVGGSVSERLKKAEANRNRGKQPENQNQRQPNNPPRHPQQPNQHQQQPHHSSQNQGHQQHPRPHGGHHQGSTPGTPAHPVRAPENEQLTFAALAPDQSIESAPPRKSHDHGALADQPAVFNDSSARRPVPMTTADPSNPDSEAGHQPQTRPQSTPSSSHVQPPRPGQHQGRQGQPPAQNPNQGQSHGQPQGQPHSQGHAPVPVQHQGQSAPRQQPQQPQQQQRPVLYNDVFHVDEARHRFFEYFGGHPQVDEESVKMALEMDRQAFLKASEPAPAPQPEFDSTIEDGAPPSKNGHHQNSGQPMRRDTNAVSPMGGPTAPNRDRRPGGGGRNHQGKRRSKNSKNRERQHRQAMSLMSK